MSYITTEIKNKCVHLTHRITLVYSYIMEKETKDNLLKKINYQYFGQNKISAVKLVYNFKQNKIKLKHSSFKFSKFDSYFQYHE